MTEYASPKISALKEFLSDFEGKFVIFCEFHHSIDAVAALLDSMGIGFTTLDGRSKDKGVWEDFQEDPGIRGIVVQYASGSAGIDLYAADTCIFFEPTLSEQPQRAGQRPHPPHRPAQAVQLLLPDCRRQHRGGHLQRALELRRFRRGAFHQKIPARVREG